MKRGKLMTLGRKVAKKRGGGGGEAANQNADTNKQPMYNPMEHGRLLITISPLCADVDNIF